MSTTPVSAASQKSRKKDSAQTRDQLRTEAVRAQICTLSLFYNILKMLACAPHASCKDGCVLRSTHALMIPQIQDWHTHAHTSSLLADITVP